MRINLLIFGTRGDVQPALALGVGLQRAGLDVQLSTLEEFRSLVEEHGLGFIPLNANIRELLDQSVGKKSPIVSPTAENFEPPNIEPTITLFPSPADLPFALTETPEIIETRSIETQTVLSTITPRPTRTPIPTRGAPFKLIGADTVCDLSLPDGLLQVIVYNSNRRQLAGVKVIVTWDTGGEEFFTGLKPELGNAYADFLMFPDTSHAVQLAIGSEIATDLVPPTCQTPNGETFIGGYKLTFQQP